MVILRAIGAFFVKIGRWIKETAWVQPLLIVGGIFAIIFSIPYISKWVSSWFAGGDESTSFYSNYKISLSGAQNKDSDANKLLNYMATPDDLKSKDDVNKYGEKFFILFVQEECPACADVYGGFQYLGDNWNKGEFEMPSGLVGDYKPYKLYTIFIDTEESINNETQNLFQKYFFDEYGEYFEEMQEEMQTCNYAKKKGDSYTKDLAQLTDVENFYSPTLFLYEPSHCSNQLGVSEVVFNITGKDGKSGSVPQARTLYDCWYSVGDFGPQNN